MDMLDDVPPSEKDLDCQKKISLSAVYSTLLNNSIVEVIPLLIMESEINGAPKKPIETVNENSIFGGG